VCVCVWRDTATPPQHSHVSIKATNKPAANKQQERVSSSSQPASSSPPVLPPSAAPQMRPPASVCQLASPPQLPCTPIGYRTAAHRALSEKQGQALPASVWACSLDPTAPPHQPPLPHQTSVQLASLESPVCTISPQSSSSQQPRKKTKVTVICRVVCPSVLSAKHEFLRI